MIWTEDEATSNSQTIRHSVWFAASMGFFQHIPRQFVAICAGDAKLPQEFILGDLIQHQVEHSFSLSSSHFAILYLSILSLNTFNARPSPRPILICDPSDLKYALPLVHPDCTFGSSP